MLGRNSICEAFVQITYGIFAGVFKDTILQEIEYVSDGEKFKIRKAFQSSQVIKIDENFQFFIKN